MQLTLTKYVDDLTLCVRGPTDACAQASWALFDMVQEEFGEGSEILVPGDPALNIYVVESGRVELRNQEGELLQVCTVCWPSTVCPQLALFALN